MPGAGRRGYGRPVDIAGAVCVITGGGNGIGAALARRFAAAGAAGVVVADIDGAGAAAVVATLADGCGLAVPLEVTDEDAHRRVVDAATAAFGPVDLYVSNAGVGTALGIEATDGDWDHVWRVNVLAHVYAARAVLPSMLERGRGWLLNVASAAGLLVHLGDAPYTATKHAAVGFAEWLAVTYGDRGIGVSCLCPMGVDTDLLRDAVAGGLPGAVVRASGRVLPPETVADAVVEALRAERFLILPHPEVADYERARAQDRDKWLAGMRHLQARLGGPTAVAS